MIIDEGVMEKEDYYILGRMTEFVSSEEVSKSNAAKQLLILIERAVCLSLPVHFYVLFCISNEAKETSRCW